MPTLASSIFLLLFIFPTCFFFLCFLFNYQHTFFSYQHNPFYQLSTSILALPLAIAVIIVDITTAFTFLFTV